MNPVFILLVIIGVVLLWFLLAFAFKPIGNLFYRLGKDAVDQMSDKKDEEKEKKDE